MICVISKNASLRPMRSKLSPCSEAPEIQIAVKMDTPPNLSIILGLETRWCWKRLWRCQPADAAKHGPVLPQASLVLAGSDDRTVAVMMSARLFPQLGPSTWRGRVASRLACPCGCLLRLRVGLFCLLRRPRPPISTFYCKEEKLGQLNDYLHVHHHHHHRLAFL